MIIKLKKVYWSYIKLGILVLLGMTFIIFGILKVIDLNKEPVHEDTITIKQPVEIIQPVTTDNSNQYINNSSSLAYVLSDNMGTIIAIVIPLLFGIIVLSMLKNYSLGGYSECY